MIFLTKGKLPLAKTGVREYDEAINLIYQISEINFKILRYHYERLPGCQAVKTVKNSKNTY
jgi:hypothetical protein